MMAKSGPRLAGGGENVPLDVLRVLAEWLSVLESRGTVPGSGLGGMYGSISSFEDSLSGTCFFLFVM
jgi:ion channel-forming bestrophin family protein